MTTIFGELYETMQLQSTNYYGRSGVNVTEHRVYPVTRTKYGLIFTKKRCVMVWTWNPKSSLFEEMISYANEAKAILVCNALCTHHEFKCKQTVLMLKAK